MTDIVALLTDATIRPALIGFSGVAIGAIVTVTGQGLGRRAERLHKVKEEVAAVIGNSHQMRSNYGAFYHPGTPLNIQDKMLETLNTMRPELYKGCNVLYVIAPAPIAAAAVNLANVHTVLDNYAHPANGTGKVDEYKNLAFHIRQIEQAEDALTKATRAPAIWRWPAIFINRIANHRREKAIAKASATVPQAEE